MARLRKNENSVNITPAAGGAATARRKTASAPHKPAATNAYDILTEPEPEASMQAAAPVAEAGGRVTEAKRTAMIEYLPTRETIAALAYSFWVERGCAEGSPEQDWLRAENDLRRRAAATK